MTAPRFDMYTLVHKGQRKKLFELTITAGQLAAEDRSGREALAADLEATLASLIDHTEAEARHFGPLYATADAGTGARLGAEHGEIAVELSRLRAAAAEALAAARSSTDLELYRALARFTSAYLAHVDAEECSMTVLWAAFDDDALARAQGALVASHPRPSVQFNLRNMLAAASPAERIGFLANLRRNMPEAAFLGVRELVGPIVSANEWAGIDGL